MIRNRVYSKGEQIHALISNTGNYNTLFPVKGIIHDVKHGDTITEYQIKILTIYDDIDFIRRNLIGKKFRKDFGNKTTTWKLTRKNYTKKQDFQDHLDAKGELYKVIVDGPMVCKYKSEMMELFNNIHNFFIEKAFSDLFELCTRTPYKGGTYHYGSRGIFKAHLIKFLGDRGYGTDSFVDDILYRIPSRELDKID